MDGLYTPGVPKLWTDAIASHRRTVRDAILDAATDLVARQGLRGVTMSQIAAATGIGRATLYRYFSDVDAVLLAWHERQVDGHLRLLADARDSADDPERRLAAVLEAFALTAMASRGRHDAELAALLHLDEHVLRAEHRLRVLIADVLTDAARAGSVRDDIPTDELVGYCLHAISAGGRLSSKAAVRRLINVTLTGLRPPT